MSYRLVLSLLLAGSVLFGAVVVVELEAAGADDAVVAEVASRPEAVAAIHRQPSQRFDDLVATTLARPLFSSTRRPPQSATAGGAGDDLTDRRLTGIVTAPGHRLAIFAVSGDKPLTVAEGDEVSGWRVESITPREVSLTGPTGTKTLQPKLDPNLAPPPAPPATANAAGRAPNPVPPGAPRLPMPSNAAAAGLPNRGVPINVPGAPARPLRLPQQR